MSVSQGDEWIEEANFVPRDWRVEYEGEANPPLQGILTSYWSNYYTDKYCKSDYVAIGDRSAKAFRSLMTICKQPRCVHEEVYFCTGTNPLVDIVISSHLVSGCLDGRVLGGSVGEA